MEFDFGNYDISSSVNFFDPMLQTIPAELPSYGNVVLGSGGFVAEAPIPSLQDIPRSEGLTFGGALESVSGAANSLIGVWNTVNTIQDNAAMARFNREVTLQKLDLQKVQTLGSIDVAKAQTTANLAIEKARAQMGLANETARVYGSSGNSPGISLAMVAAIAIGVYYLSKGKKA